MDKVKARPLRPYEKKKLRRMKRQHTNAVNARHARIILLSCGGMSNRDIATATDCTSQWVRIIIHRFNADGIEGIAWYPFYQTHDSPRRFLADVRVQIAEIALSSPKSLIGMNEWSLPKLRTFLIEQKIVSNISVEWLRQLLHRFAIRLRRTKTWKDSTDPDFWPKYQALRRLYRRRPKGGRRLSIDEFGPLNLQPRHGLCLACADKVGVKRLRATYNRKGGVRHFLAYYDLETDRLYGRFTKCKTWVQFLSFLKWVRRRYPRTQTLHIVLDNYGPHTKIEVRQWALAHNIRLYFTPTNASWLNRIECHFTALRKFALNSSDHRTHEEQQEAIESYLVWRNRQRLLSQMSWDEYKRLQKSRQDKNLHRAKLV
jgi:transposase